jgi:hypothetical protein
MNGLRQICRDDAETRRRSAAAWRASDETQTGVALRREYGRLELSDTQLMRLRELSDACGLDRVRRRQRRDLGAACRVEGAFLSATQNERRDSRLTTD